MADTERTQQPTEFKERNYSGLFRSVPIIFKIIELIVSIGCIALIDDPANNSRVRAFVTPRTGALAYSTFSSFIIICGVIILGKLVRDNIPWKMLVMINLTGVIMFMSTGVSVFNNYAHLKETTMWTPHTQRLDLLGATGGIAVLNSGIFIIDFIISVWLGLRGTLSTE